MLLDGTYADSRESQQELLSLAQQECDRLIGSVNRILDLSRMEAKMMEYVFAPAQVAPSDSGNRVEAGTHCNQGGDSFTIEALRSFATGENR